MANVLPPQQFLNEYRFFTEPTHIRTTLVVIRKVADDGTFKDVVLDCAGKLDDWKALGTSGRYAYTRIDLQQPLHDGVVNSHGPVGNCDNGQHEMESEGPFGVTVWGVGPASSYAYPVGGRIQSINGVVVPPVPK